MAVIRKVIGPMTTWFYSLKIALIASNAYIPTTILCSLNEFGPYHLATSNLQPGMMQHMIFDAADIGPFYFSETERNNRKFDKPSGKKVKEYFKKEQLISKLESDGMKVSKGTTRKKCQQLCENRGIATTYLIDGITEGWVGKQKGSFQMI
mmetsp:Transcript_4361/g.5018  ORF Transcript_4361/g.5018 Transcript_4361/m.5018 type:complete len:151 (+) Transcript_4361:1511-1963(+)